jgi:CO/xanthine dehydrogenase Mo-binding subunit
MVPMRSNIPVRPLVTDCKMPTATDRPSVQSVLLESDDQPGPFESKGIGETGLWPMAPAIDNAIHNAEGVRIHDRNT